MRAKPADRGGSSTLSLSGKTKNLKTTKQQTLISCHPSVLLTPVILKKKVVVTIHPLGGPKTKDRNLKGQSTYYGNWGESKVHSFLEVIAFLHRAPKESPASKMSGFPQKSTKNRPNCRQTKCREHSRY